MTEHFPNAWINIRRVGHVLVVVFAKLQNHLIDYFVGGIAPDEFSKKRMRAASDSALKLCFGMCSETKLMQRPIHLRDDVPLGINQRSVQIKKQRLDFHSVDNIRDSNPEKARL